jgi:SAM-dependent methyltransferase
MPARFSKRQHLEMNQAAWDAAHRLWFERVGPDWHQKYRDGHIALTEEERVLLGDVTDLDVLQLSCAGDANQAFSLANMGARVTACDFSPVAIEIARENARKIGLDVRFVVVDSQRLSTLDACRFDLVFADYNLYYYEDLTGACENWFRVLRPGGRLLVHETNPLTSRCLEASDSGLKIIWAYDDRSPEYYSAAESHIYRLGNLGLEAVEFHHTMADVVNAVVQAGLSIEKMVETTYQKDEDSPDFASMVGLPKDYFIAARKTPAAE